VWWNVTGRWTPGPYYNIAPGFSASPWLPDGTQVLYEYQAALAVFNISDVDLDRDFQWGVDELAYRYWLKERLARAPSPTVSTWRRRQTAQSSRATSR
jgi:hypothetical protein